MKSRFACILVPSMLLVAGSLFAAEPAPFITEKPTLLLEKGAGEGPAWDPKLGLLFSGPEGIWQLPRQGKANLFRKDAGTNGLMFDREGRLVACEPVQRRVTRMNADGKLEVLTDSYDGKKYNQPNDLCLDSKNRIYFTDPCYGDRSKMEMIDPQGRKIEGVYRIDTDGKVTRIIGLEVNRPNGIRITPDDKYLYVADNNNNEKGGARKLWRFDLKADGTVDFQSQKLIYDWGTSRGPDGIKMDREGRIYVAGGLNKANPPSETNEKKGGIYIFSSKGEFLQFIHIDRDEVTNCAFGGDDLKTLYITAGGTLWSVKVPTAGEVYWPKSK